MVYNKPEELLNGRQAVKGAMLTVSLWRTFVSEVRTKVSDFRVYTELPEDLSEIEEEAV